METENKSKKFASLIAAGDRAKDLGQYELANMVFAVLLAEYVSLTPEEREATTERPPVAWTLYETDDRMAENGIGQAYYDLAHIATFDEGVLESFCIPVPLLKQTALATFMKLSPSYINRTSHNREVVENPDPAEVEAVRREIYEICGEHQAQWYLTACIVQE
jgi:hypothetical protein